MAIRFSCDGVSGKEPEEYISGMCSEKHCLSRVISDEELAL
jgi:hypothetical protein